MAKKSAPKKAASPAKKPTVKKVASKSSPAKKAAAPEQNFFEFRATQQTLYWAIFGVVAIIFTLWIYSLDKKVRDLYDQLDESTYSSDIQMITREAANSEE